MKKLNLIYLLIAAIFVSCSSDDDSAIPVVEEPTVKTPPTIALESGEEGVFEGVIGAPQKGTMIYGLKANATDGFKSLEVFKIVDGNETSYELLDSSSPNYTAGNSQAYTLNYTFSEADLGKSLSFKAVITDDNNAMASISFGEATVKRAMIKSSITLQTKFPITDFTVDTYGFLYVGNDSNSATNLANILSENYYSNAVAVFSVNDGSGFYLASPNSVVETDLVDLFADQPKPTTKFKEQALTSVEFDALNIYDTYYIESVYANAEFNSSEEKVEQVGTEGKIFSFFTDDNRVALARVSVFEIAGSDVKLGLDIFITQL